MKYSKLMVGTLIAGLLTLSGCGALHDGSGWEHNMDEESKPTLYHKH